MARLDHIALVVVGLEATLARLDLPTERVGPIEEFPSEGTREVYLGQGAGKLLLLQALGTEGPYARSVAKRGHGLHHVALQTPDLDGFLDAVQGWLLHPKSVGTIARSRTAWLARPGVPTLVEVHEAPPQGGAPLVEAVEIPAALEELEPACGLSTSPDAETWLTVGGRRFSVRELATAAEA